MMDTTSRALKLAPAPALAAYSQLRNRPTLRDRLLLAFFLLLLGALSTIAISWLLAFNTELTDDPSLTGQGVDGPRNWTVQGWSGFGSLRLASTRNVPNWSVLQAAARSASWECASRLRKPASPPAQDSAKSASAR